MGERKLRDLRRAPGAAAAGEGDRGRVGEVARAPRQARRRAPGVVAISAGALMLLLGVAAAGAPAHIRGRPDAPRARASRALRASDRASLHYVSASGSTLYEVGRATGTMPGSMRVHMRIAATFTGSFTIYIRGGSISGRGSAKPHGSGTYESFAGTLRVTGGTGRYRHARGHAGLYGVFDRKNYALTVQTTGVLRY